MTAARLAARLEIGPRTIYRDIATLQARGVPIEGEAGIGYVLRKGYELPPLAFTTEEIEAIAVGVRMVRRLRDQTLDQASASVLSKLATELPDRARRALLEPRIWVSDGSAARPQGVDQAMVREAIRDQRKLSITYRDKAERRTRRTIWPIAMVYYVDATLIAAWCERRRDYRHFRVERVVACRQLGDSYASEAERVLAGWLVLQTKVANGDTVGDRSAALG